MNQAEHGEQGFGYPACNGADLPARILLVAPYTPKGGGMGRMMAYLAFNPPHGGPAFETVESRGDGNAVSSAWPLLKAAWLIRRRARGPGKVILHVNMAEGSSVVRKGLLLLWGRHLGIPTVLHLHAAEIVSFYDRLPNVARSAVRHIFRAATVCIVLGQPWRSWLHEVIGVERARIEVLRNGVPKPTILPFPVAHHPPTLVFLGNLLARKGLPDLLTALSDTALRHLDWHLVVAGGGDARPLQAQAERMGIGDRVRFAGWLGRAEIVTLLANATALVLPSYHEGLPLVLLEAASLGLPCITTRVGAIAEVFTDGSDVLLIAPGDIAALTDAVRRLIDEPALRARLGQNAKGLFAETLSIDSFRRSLSAIYARHCTIDVR